MIKLNVYGCYIPTYLVGRINNYENIFVLRSIFVQVQRRSCLHNVSLLGYEKDFTYNVELNIMNQYLLNQYADPGFFYIEESAGCLAGGLLLSCFRYCRKWLPGSSAAPVLRFPASILPCWNCRRRCFYIFAGIPEDALHQFHDRYR